MRDKWWWVEIVLRIISPCSVLISAYHVSLKPTRFHESENRKMVPSASWRCHIKRIGVSGDIMGWQSLNKTPIGHSVALSSLVGGFTLRSVFPRIYALVVKKLGYVSDFDSWTSDDWSWNIEFHRDDFNWEKEQWDSFQQLIHDCFISKDFQEKLTWKGHPSSNYFSHSFRW
ncbi:Uncharacterized protein TCM_005049 [Theobroma cacao]|uniref:Uncharacterized protein n=1 Tax=Theobroma cacao TaxID=3641 RepID=A0A061DU62_THECC|nr:Uncharacterized protein TCM_005049 [Theobroma cacao]